MKCSGWGGNKEQGVLEEDGRRIDRDDGDDGERQGPAGEESSGRKEGCKNKCMLGMIKERERVVGKKNTAC